MIHCGHHRCGGCEVLEMIRSEIRHPDAMHLKRKVLALARAGSESEREHQALPLCLYESTPRFKPELRVAWVAGRKFCGGGPVQESEVEVGEGEAGDAGLEAMGEKEDCVNVGKV